MFYNKAISNKNARSKSKAQRRGHTDIRATQSVGHDTPRGVVDKRVQDGVEVNQSFRGDTLEDVVDERA